MKKNKKIKLEDLKIQSFSTSHLLSKEETDKLMGGNHTGYPCTYTNGCFDPSANVDCTNNPNYGCGTGTGNQTQVGCPTDPNSVCCVSTNPNGCSAASCGGFGCTGYTQC